MKEYLRPTLILISSLLLAFVVAGFSQSIPAEPVASHSFHAILSLQVTATPQPQPNRSVIGSTDWITLMSFVIVAIIIIPILLKRKEWSRS